MTLIGIGFICIVAPILLLIVALAWLWLGQKILGCIFGG